MELLHWPLVVGMYSVIAFVLWCVVRSGDSRED